MKSRKITRAHGANREKERKRRTDLYVERVRVHLAWNLDFWMEKRGLLASPVLSSVERNLEQHHDPHYADNTISRRP